MREALGIEPLEGTSVKQRLTEPVVLGQRPVAPMDIRRLRERGHFLDPREQLFVCSWCAGLDHGGAHSFLVLAALPPD